MKLQRVSAGQTLPFIGMLILIMIAFAGLTIDSGNAMEKQRRIQHAANSSAVAAMNGVILQNTDGVILDIINKTMTDNNVKRFQRVNVGQAWGTDPDVVYFSAQYLDASGAFLGDVGAQPNQTPADKGAAHVVVQTSLEAQNTFSKVVGVKGGGREHLRRQRRRRGRQRPLHQRCPPDHPAQDLSGEQLPVLVQAGHDGQPRPERSG
jgi:hypothetical protein